MQSHRIMLRPYLDADAKAHSFATRQSSALGQRWLDWMSDDYSEAQSLEWIRFAQLALNKSVAFDFAIIERHYNTLIGAVALNRVDWSYRTANLGYWLRQDKCGKGLMTEAVNLMADYAFDVLDLRRLEISIAEENMASRRVAEKSGAQFESLARAKVTDNGHPCHAAVYSLLPEDR